MLKKNKIKIKLNGREISVNKGTNLGNLINKFKFPLSKIAIEKNNLIVEKKKISKILLRPNDKIEIVHFIGGGWLKKKIILKFQIKNLTQDL